ncbi:YcxB family protein [Niabella aurantiaca]|uniref:YcxB family protein n=1 Tax=Niabella aurantiaca TaxID=379900 RepID=UPI000369E792|nr:YcxB family protein [Niabella aurantiaca]
MILTYQPNQNDFLQNHLFIASKTVRIKKKRRRSWLMVTAVMALLGLLFYQSGNTFLARYFFIFGIFSLLFYPLYQRVQYRDHYDKFIEDAYRNRIGRPITLKLTDAAIETTDSGSTSSIHSSEIENITETGDYFYFKLKTGAYLSLPKKAADDIHALTDELKQRCGRLQIEYIEELHWKWR